MGEAAEASDDVAVLSRLLDTHAKDGAQRSRRLFDEPRNLQDGSFLELQPLGMNEGHDGEMPLFERKRVRATRREAVHREILRPGVPVIHARAVAKDVSRKLIEHEDECEPSLRVKGPRVQLALDGVVYR